MLHGVAVLQYAAQLEADEIGIMSLGDQFRRRGALVVLGVLGAPLAVAVADAAGVEHGHHLVLPAGGLLVAGRGDVEEGGVLQRLQHRNIPLTGDEERGGKEIRVFAVQIERSHASHGLPGGVEAAGIDGILLCECVDETHRGLHLIGDGGLIVYHHLREVGNQNKGRVACSSSVTHMSAPKYCSTISPEVFPGAVASGMNIRSGYWFSALYPLGM